MEEYKGKRDLGEIKEKNWDANMDILKNGLDAYKFFELKGNLTGSTVRNTGETGDIYS